MFWPPELPSAVCSIACFPRVWVRSLVLGDPKTIHLNSCPVSHLMSRLLSRSGARDRRLIGRNRWPQPWV